MSQQSQPAVLQNFLGRHKFVEPIIRCFVVNSFFGRILTLFFSKSSRKWREKVIFEFFLVYFFTWNLGCVKFGAFIRSELHSCLKLVLLQGSPVEASILAFLTSLYSSSSILDHPIPETEFSSTSSCSGLLLHSLLGILSLLVLWWHTPLYLPGPFYPIILCTRRYWIQESGN